MPRQTGFARLERKKRQKLGSRGGKAAHETGEAHEFTSSEARKAIAKRWAASAEERRKKKEAKAEAARKKKEERAKRRAKKKDA